MKFSIEQRQDGLHLDAQVPPDQQKPFLDELAKCAAGTCSCPTPQFEKLDAIDILPGATSVAIDLKVKAGESIDVQDIAKCLEHTAASAGR